MIDTPRRALPLRRVLMTTVALVMLVSPVAPCSPDGETSEASGARWTVSSCTSRSAAEGRSASDNGLRMDRALTMDTRHVVDAQNSGLKGIVTSRTLSGVPGGQVTETPASVEFAVAPIEGRAPVYQKAVFVRSDAYGRYEIALAPGNYWIGPKAKALAPASYRPAALVFPETTVVVKEGRFTQLDLVETGFAP